MGLSLKVMWQCWYLRNKKKIQGHTHTAFVEAFKKELVRLLFKPMDVQELQDPENVSTICVKNLNSIVNKVNNTKSLMIDMKPKDAIKLDTVQLKVIMISVVLLLK